MSIETQDSKPWYKEPMVWLVVGIPLLSVFWGGVIITLAVNTKDSLVSDSYYKDGVSYTENLEMDNKAARLLINAQIVFVNDEVKLNLEGYLDEEPASLSLQLIHPTLQDQDSSIYLQRLEPGTYAGVGEIELPAKRRIWLQSPEQGWRIRSTEFIEPSKVIRLSAQ